jgi:endonuclease V-like protein UPF0215 family
MNTYLTIIIFNAIRLAVSSGLFDRVSTIVQGLISARMEGEDKKEAVKNYLQQNKIEIRGVLLDGIIFATRLRYELK